MFIIIMVGLWPLCPGLGLTFAPNSNRMGGPGNGKHPKNKSTLLYMLPTRFPGQCASARMGLGTRHFNLAGERRRKPGQTRDGPDFWMQCSRVSFSDVFWRTAGQGQVGLHGEPATKPGIQAPSE